MANADVDRVRAVYEQWAVGNLRAGGEPFAEENVYVPLVDGGTPFVGRAAVAEYMRGFLDQWDDCRLVAEQIEEVGDAIVVTEFQRATGSSSREQAPPRSRGGRATRGRGGEELRGKAHRARAMAVNRRAEPKEGALLTMGGLGP